MRTTSFCRPITGSVRCDSASLHRSRQNSSSADAPSRLRSAAACAGGGARARRAGQGARAATQAALPRQPAARRRARAQASGTTAQACGALRLTTTLRRWPSPSASPLSRRSASVRSASVSSSFRLRPGGGAGLRRHAACMQRDAAHAGCCCLQAGCPAPPHPSNSLREVASPADSTARNTCSGLQGRHVQGGGAWRAGRYAAKPCCPPAPCSGQAQRRACKGGRQAHPTHPAAAAAAARAGRAHVMNDMDMRRDSISAASNTFLASRLRGRLRRQHARQHACGAAGAGSGGRGAKAVLAGRGRACTLRVQQGACRSRQPGGWAQPGGHRAPEGQVLGRVAAPAPQHEVHLLPRLVNLRKRSRGSQRKHSEVGGCGLERWAPGSRPGPAEPSAMSCGRAVGGGGRECRPTGRLTVRPVPRKPPLLESSAISPSRMCSVETCGGHGGRRWGRTHRVCAFDRAPAPAPRAPPPVPPPRCCAPQLRSSAAPPPVPA